VVLGAGGNLKKDIGNLPYSIDDCITISANNKPLKVYSNPNYIFTISESLCKEVQKDPNAEYSFKISTLERYSDYLTNRKDIWYAAPGAGALAVSLACHLSGNPILLCGFDLFRKDHCDGISRNVVEKTLSVDFFIERWSHIFDFHKNAVNIRVVGDSPLSQLFGKLD
jgi:hypothetical protein